MDRRDFIKYSGASLVGLAFGGALSPLQAKSKDKKYNIVILGDTHFDTEPASVYHSNYNEKVEWLNRVQRAEFKRNGEMWRERCPRLMKRAARLIDDNTRMVFQLGDLVQGDCGSGDVHRKMLSDVMDSFKGQLGGLPFVTVAGNHDIRGTDALKVYHEYMPQRMSEELGKKITKTDFAFNIGDDAYIVIDFNTPDDAEVERLWADCNGTRHTFVLVHGPLLPYDEASARWFYHGGASEAETQKRRHFRELFAKRNTVCLCGHTHRTEFADWYGDGGRITQMTVNSVWASEGLGKYEVDSQGADQFGTLRKKMKNDDGTPIKDESALFDEYRPGLKAYSHSPAAGSYKMTVTPKKITVDFYAGDSEALSQRFVLRG